LIAKVPGGSSRIATLAAALYLLREDKNQFDLDKYITEAKLLFEEDGGVPANNMGDGKIADNKKGIPYKKGTSVLKRFKDFPSANT
jgi:hypothetical protein